MFSRLPFASVFADTMAAYQAGKLKQLLSAVGYSI